MSFSRDHRKPEPVPKGYVRLTLELWAPADRFDMSLCVRRPHGRGQCFLPKAETSFVPAGVSASGREQVEVLLPEWLARREGLLAERDKSTPDFFGGGS